MFVILLFLLVLGNIVASINNPIVVLPNGNILGRQATTFANTSYYAFQKIPYAAPPVGPLRFKAPQPPQNWDGLLNTTYLDVSCYQLKKSTPPESEDCLFVNVYTPQLSNESLAVMFYVHGGSFTSQTSMSFPPDLFVDNGVILVTVNYRLGPFGFASTQDAVLPGNNGLKDQQLAIKWTHDNIHLFGGNPEKITLFGESAGSAAVSYQLLNQNSKGLFSGMILESGSFLCPWSYQRNARSVIFGTAARLNSTFENSTDSEALLQFLQTIDSEDLNEAARRYLVNVQTPWYFDVSQGNIFAPVIEVQNPDAFLTRKMYGLLQAGNVLAVPLLMGFNSEESLLFNKDPDVFQSVLEAWDEDLDLIVPDDMYITDKDKHLEMAMSIRDIYTGGEPFGTRLGDGIRYSTDVSFTKSIIRHAQLFSSIAKTYFYKFSYDGELGGISVHYDGAESVGHSEERYYLFCSELDCDFSTYPENDQITSQRLIKLWTDFAKYQNPTPEPSDLLQNITWPQLSVDDGDFLYLDIGTDLEIRNHPREETVQKWNDLYDSLGYSDFDTY